ncbi:hypothetical protein EJF36_19145 [Bacillus sp. HMF5848]|uniref:hypothetical protein n=1 Tax=Bacillus sp. HMF5848 TaxID=2495421 RepID=UPI000F7859E4|nr:hypothetical protein [Bacillus sp. HMF5848]RSK28821.1 hypothetical protein EJF36_19145 [Bacillus sp. HMF5848]
MIVSQEAAIKSFLSHHLAPFSPGGNYAVVMIDPYFGGRNVTLQLRVEAYINYIFQALPNPNIIWFYSKMNSFGAASPQGVSSIDLSRQGIAIHDRFLFLYDGNRQQFVGHFHLGGSVNSFDINGNQSISMMRLSVLQHDEVRDLGQLLQQLELIYVRETTYSNWGC